MRGRNANSISVRDNSYTRGYQAYQNNARLCDFPAPEASNPGSAPGRHALQTFAKAARVTLHLTLGPVPARHRRHMKKVAVILSGCGVFDGAEIHESVLTLLALDQAGADIHCAAPNIPQAHVVNHLDGSTSESESRNVLQESARIARGAIADLAQLDPADFDAIALPGGFGAAKNLCGFAFDSESFEVDPTLADFLTKAHALGKPIAFACIAPAVAAKLFGPEGLRYTIGTDEGTATALSKWGGEHVSCPVDDIVVDAERKIVTTPAYMLAERISEAHAGLGKMVDALLALAD